MRPIGSSTTLAWACFGQISKRAEELACQINLATTPSCQTARPIGKLGMYPPNRNGIARLTNSLGVNTKDKIGMRDLTAKLTFFCSSQIAFILRIIHNIQGTRWPATANGTANAARNRRSTGWRRAAHIAFRNPWPVSMGTSLPVAIQIAWFRCFWRAHLCRFPALSKPVNTAGIRMVIIGKKPAG